MAKIAHSTPTSTRRTLGAGLFAVIAGGTITSGIAAGAAASLPTEPDAGQITLCERYVAARSALNSKPNLTDGDPRWEAYFAITDEITDWKPTTVAGLVAKARVAPPAPPVQPMTFSGDTGACPSVAATRPAT